MRNRQGQRSDGLLRVWRPEVVAHSRARLRQRSAEPQAIVIGTSSAICQDLNMPSDLGKHDSGGRFDVV